MFFAYSFSLLSSFSFLGFFVDVKLDLRSLAKLSESSQVSPSDRSVNAKNFFCHLVDFRYPQSLDAAFINTSLAVVLLFACSRSLAFVFLVLSRYCYKLLLFDRHVGPAFLYSLVF